MITKDFDWIFYVHFFNDIKSAGIDNEEKAYDHYKLHGNLENRKISFDVDRFIRSNDVYGDSIFNFNRKNTSIFLVNKELMSYIIDNCKIEPDARVLEIGCSIACYSLPIIKHVKNGAYYGLESNRHCLGWCRRKMKSSCPHALFRHLDLKANQIIPDDISELDVVYSLSTFITLQSYNIMKYLNEINRVLKKGGLLIISVFLANSLMNNQTSTITTRTRQLKASLTKNNGGLCLVNQLGEQANVYSDLQFQQWLDAAHFEIKDIIFGSWNIYSGTGVVQGTPTDISETIYQDLIVAIKIR